MRVRTFSGCNLHKTKDKTCLNGTTYLSQVFFHIAPWCFGDKQIFEERAFLSNSFVINCKNLTRCSIFLLKLWGVSEWCSGVKTSYLLHGWINKHVKKLLNNISLIFLLEWARVFWGNIGTSVIEEPFLWNSLYSIWFCCDAQHWIAHLKSPGIHHLFDAYTFSLSTTFLTKQKTKAVTLQLCEWR